MILYARWVETGLYMLALRESSFKVQVEDDRIGRPWNRGVRTGQEPSSLYFITRRTCFYRGDAEDNLTDCDPSAWRNPCEILSTHASRQHFLNLVDFLEEQVQYESHANAEQLRFIQIQVSLNLGPSHEGVFQQLHLKMTVTRDPHLLVASHISAAFGPPKRVQVPTSRRATRPIQHKVETLENHAIYASICADDRVGNILLRVINGGYHLELTLLDSDDEPTRFEFSERILPMPAVVPSHLNQRSAEVLALTYDGTLYRLVYPLEGRQYHEIPTKEWCARHSIYSSVPRPLHGIALVHNEQRVVIALENGALLQMDAHGATQQGWST